MRKALKKAIHNINQNSKKRKPKDGPAVPRVKFKGKSVSVRY